MKISLLLFTVMLSGCTLNEVKEIKKEPLSIFQQKVEMDKVSQKGILVFKRPLGDRFICYYNYIDADRETASGYSMVSKTCSGGVLINRK